MTTLASHSRALMVLDKVLEEVGYDNERVNLYLATQGRGTNDFEEEVVTEVFFFGIGADIYVVNLYSDGGEIQLLQTTDTWSVFPPKEEPTAEMDVDVNE